MPTGDDHTIKWQTPMDSLGLVNYVATSIGLGPGGIVYVGYSNAVVALRLKDGSVAWSYIPGGDGQLGPFGIDTTRNGLVVPSWNPRDSAGMLVSVGGDGTLRWEKAVGVGLMRAPAMSRDGFMYVHDDRALLKLDLEGNRKWANELSGDECVLSPDEDVVYTSLSHVTAVSTGDGSVLWTFEEPTEPGQWIRYTKPVVNSNGVLYVAHKDQSAGSPRGVFALNPAGEKLWSTNGVGTVRYSPMLINDILVVGNNDGDIFVLSTTTGKIRAQYSIGGTEVMPMSTSGSTLYAVSRTSPSTSSVYACELQNGYVRWSHEFERGDHHHTATVGPDGTLYMTASNSVIAIAQHDHVAVQVGSASGGSGVGGGSNDGGGGDIVGLVIITILAVAAVFAVRHGSKR